MATAVESVEGNVDPDAECRIGRNLYLIVWEKSVYTVATEPRKIPKGVGVKAIASEKKGLRQFEVYSEKITDTYEVVTVGTFHVENGYAYVAGRYIPGEEPHDSYEIAWIPPIKITYLYDTPEDEQYYTDFMLGIRSYLIKMIRKCNPRKLRVADIFHFFQPYDIDQPNLCGRCKVLKYEGGSDLCDACGVATAVESVEGNVDRPSPAPAMATAVESVEGANASEGRGVMVVNKCDHPHAAECRIGEYLYFVVWEFGVYGTYLRPKKIPKGDVVKAIAADRCEKGLRHFEVYMEGEHTFDLVTVGTFMIDNGYAYVAGPYIPGEKPHPSNEDVCIPPFKLTFPLEKRGRITREEFRVSHRIDGSNSIQY